MTPRPLLKACLNGARSRDEHPALPITSAELAADAQACVRAGADAVHLHPRDRDGRESLDATAVDPAVVAVRAACGAPVGVATGAWVEPDPERRAALVAKWTEPAFASVNVSEPGAEAVMRVLLDRDVGVEAGVWSAEDAEWLAATGLARRLTRVLVEIIDASAETAVECAREIEAALDRLGIDSPRLLHGEDATCWAVLRHARVAGRNTRIGLEDTLTLPDGMRAAGNEALVRAAAALRPSPHSAAS